MAALRSVTDERVEAQRELDAILRDRASYAQARARIERDGEPADSSWLRKLGWQIDACDRHAARIASRLQEETA
jgi:hypothetical protein